MTYSQKRLLELLRAGKVPGESSVPKHIETVMSNVFLFPEKVYKLYKNNSEFVNGNFVDLSSTTERFSFAKADFEWNQQLSKEVYIQLKPVKIHSEEILFLSEETEAEELLLVTKRLPAGTSLFEHLQEDDLTENDYYNIGKQFCEREKNLVYHKKLPDESIFENMEGRNADVIAWVKGAEPHVSSAEREQYSVQLTELLMKAYENDKAKIGICIDIHSLNAFYMEQTLYPFDCYSVKYEWRFGPPILNIFRLATDVYAFAGENAFRAVMRGYHECANKEFPSQEVEKLFVMYSALIMVSYLYMLAQTDNDKQKSAIRYHEFLRHYTAV